MYTTTKNTKEISFFIWKKSVFENFKNDVFLSDIEKQAQKTSVFN